VLRLGLLHRLASTHHIVIARDYTLAVPLDGGAETAIRFVSIDC